MAVLVTMFGPIMSWATSFYLGMRNLESLINVSLGIRND